MSLLGFSCRPCSVADPTNDTVKIDMEAVIREQQEERDARERIEAEVRAAREAQDLEDQEAQEADARRLAEEQRRVAEEESAEQRQKQIEESRIAQEAKERAAEEVAAQEAEMKGKLSKLLKEYGVAEVNQKRKSLMSFKYPLHYAVEKGDAEAVRLLLHCKADASLSNSSKKTALQMAEKGKTKDETITSMLRAA